MADPKRPSSDDKHSGKQPHMDDASKQGSKTPGKQQDQQSSGQRSQQGGADANRKPQR